MLPVFDENDGNVLRVVVDLPYAAQAAPALILLSGWPLGPCPLGPPMSFLVGGRFHVLPSDNEESLRFILAIDEPDIHSGIGFIDFAIKDGCLPHCKSLQASFAIPGLANPLYSKLGGACEA